MLEFGALSEWCFVKLELGPTEEFPKGSPARAFLLRLPLSRDGAVDERACAAAPRSAFVRRFWQNEPDRSGAVQRNSSGWNFTFSDGQPDCRYHLDDGSICTGGTVQVMDQHGTRLPFKVVSVRPG